MSKVRVDVYAPGPPPALAQVCRESRAVALGNGSPRSFDRGGKRGSSAWYNPSRDFVVSKDKVPLRPRNLICPDLWKAVNGIVLTIRSKDSMGARAKAFLNPDTITQLRQTTSPAVPPRHRPCGPCRSRDEHDASRFRKIPSGAMDPGRYDCVLMHAFDRLEERTSWTRIVWEFRRQWLMVNRKYDQYRNGRSRGLPVPHEVSDDWDENDQ
ncbi:hypothetical protein DL766_000633 [Monosporascus sp. MC13-8B]|uniref:Uncharacterized protein n=1 Tax=Monosporascus cannonballus TaxID=155416 RepID=A0ABY0H0V1_9PEZI|nr:hypothetical protein DL762_008403 [Monosporascus cannonballus]RYP38993.1 hypothetical protein DL766_000633 [Monosporascus sp. MC13-8B]